MIVVYRFRMFDSDYGDWVVQLSKSTEERIVALGGSIVEGTAEAVASSSIDADGRYIPRPARHHPSCDAPLT
jgi:hypothetical protein